MLSEKEKLETVAEHIHYEIEQLQDSITARINNSDFDSFETALKNAELYRELSNKLLILDVLDKLDISKENEKILYERLFNMIEQSDSSEASLLSNISHMIKLEETVENYVESHVKEIADNGL